MKKVLCEENILFWKDTREFKETAATNKNVSSPCPWQPRNEQENLVSPGTHTNTHKHTHTYIDTCGT